jgi:hypothetical protein
MLLTSVIAALLSATPVQATEWTAVAQSEDTLILADRSSVRRQSDGKVRARMFYVFSADERGIAAVEGESEFDCANKRYRRTHVTGFDAQGGQVIDGDVDGEWDLANQDDIGTQAFTWVCGGAKFNPALRVFDGDIPKVIVDGREILGED